MQKICIVIPCYNEEKRFPVNEFIEFYDKTSDVDFFLVNDGSKDKTMELLSNLIKGREDRIQAYNLPENQGKAEAVRLGMLNAILWKDFRAVGYFDADFATPLNEIFLLDSYLCQKEEYKISFGSRVRRIGAIIERSAKRHYFGRVFSTFASLMLNLSIYDTQCGAKLFKKEVIPELFDKPFLSRWLFDVEIFARVRDKYGIENAIKQMIEVPLSTWLEKGGSKLSLKHLIKVPIEMLKIYFKYKQK